MAISIQYKGWEFEFDSMPTSEEIAKRYQARIANTDVVMPVPTPVPLERNNGLYTEAELEGRRIVVCSPNGSEVGAPIVERIRECGATVVFDDGALASARAEGDRFAGLVVDMTNSGTRSGLDSLFRVVQSYFRRLTRSAHLVVVCRPEAEASSAEEAAVWEATNGFVRTVAKELGPTGSTINRLVVPSGAEAALASAVVFFLSPRSVYVSAQTIALRSAESPAVAGEKILAGKIAVVTGAARGIGRATAIQFAREGATVVGVDLPSGNDLGLEGSEGLLDGLHTQHGIVPCLLDISAPDAATRIVEIVAELGGVDILVNNAAVVRDGMVFSLGAESWRRVLDVNLDACRTLTEALLEGAQLRDGGRVIFIGSVAGVAGNVGQVNYTTCKAGLIGLTHFYARSLAARGVTVNAVLAGPTDTRLLKGLPDWIQVIGHRLNALGQAGRPEDTANLITFVASDRAFGITGQQIRCCGAALQGA